MRSYHRLTEGQRNQVYALKKAGLTQRTIADQIGVDKSTICRELQRNKGLRGYRPKQAHRLACLRQSQIPRTRILDRMWTGIEKMIREDWSPEQISGHLKDNDEPSVSPEWIYQRIYADKRRGGDLHSRLRCQKKRRKRYGSIERRGQIKNRVSIEKRPEIVDLRSRIGDWEADTVIGKQGHSVLVTLVERKTRFSVAIKAANKTARAVTDVICANLKPYQDRVLTLTYDNGREFAYHEEIARELTAEGFFAHPYHSWERGLNENTNGLIRQYIPKGKDIDDLNDAEVAQIMEKINSRPRKCLGFKTPNQLFLGLHHAVALAS
ncbi:IS30 family transposase [Pseudovibrio sp. Tun.PSC04-5.I4]|uniref:IS30 family transposase n=1 Tax=Pseudovibrio sp. Tun.PSC04-5.I4 TaxID=1798213 RepID=UPI00088303A9|nr:IS30 family transposase [Pseudovibrio sp. Tun.PSC04-5.I4]SDQ74844.1 Transposase and inactivated derivatives, IS30 family [Pseudovibrio sp. Tun.PSC04-5.I4]SDR36185.1 Transposase and inactivated derivatives, IS30 family [Pseudovibrio sp. Tun.PSC04-5.I4]